MGFISALIGSRVDQPDQQNLAVQPGQANGLLNQANSGVQQQQDFVNALQGAGQQGIAGQQQLLSMLQSQAAGGGLNPALDQLNNTTGQNVANQAALMASQRGVGQNAGLLARQVGQQGAGIQQQAAGQAALQRAQQTLAAQQMLGQQANQQVGQQGQALGNLNAAQQGLSGQAIQGQQAQNVLSTGINQANAQTNAGIAGAIGSAAIKGAGLMNQGGAVPAANGPKSRLAQHLSMGGPVEYKKGGHVAGKAKVSGDSPKNDTVPAMLSPGEIVVPRSHASDPKKAAAFAAAVAMKHRKGMK